MKLQLLRAVTEEKPFKICFVCLGNICRSPTAEGVFRHLVNERGLKSYFEINSAGTSAYHAGEPANIHSRRVAGEHGVELRSKARRFEPFDLDYFDLILAMDDENLADIRRMDGSNEYDRKIMRLRTFDPEPDNGQVPDPYEGGRRGFENVFTVIERSCESLLDELETYIED